MGFEMLFKLVLFSLYIKYSYLEQNLTKTKTNISLLNVSVAENTTMPTILSTQSLLTTTCDVNNSCVINSTLTANVTTTDLPKTTEQTISNSTTGITESPMKTFKFMTHVPTRSKKNICICDLKIQYCDINCCCDKDCSSEDRMVFSHCEEDFHEYDTRFCHYTKHIYVNHTPHELQVSQNGLFCVVANNAPPSYLVQRTNPLESFQEAEFEKAGKYSWPDYVSKNIPEIAEINYVNYTYGKPLWIIRNHHLEHLQFSKSFVVAKCVVTEYVKYLIDVRSTCTHTDVSKDNYLLRANTYFENISIISSPGSLNLSLYKKNNFLENCPRNVCLTIVPEICGKHFEHCIEIKQNFTNNLKTNCYLSIANNELSCINLVRHIKYEFYHNGTEGMIKAKLFLNLVNVTYSLNMNIDFSQTFEVGFRWWNHSLNHSSYLSGNPGYLVGKPVLIASIISVNITNNNTVITNSSVTNNTVYTFEKKLFRNPVDFTSNFMVLPSVNEDGICVLNKHEYTPVEFGFNYYFKCTIKEMIQQKNMSARALCMEVQTLIFKYWSLNNLTNSTLDNKLIGQWGNANTYNVEEWVKTMYEVDLKDILNKTWGKFENDKKTLTCGNITTLLVIEIYHARVDFEDVLNQEKILATTLRFKSYKNITFPVFVNKLNFIFSVKMATQIAFFDITTKKIRKIVDPPSLNIRLPHDFFYPFVKLNNKASIKIACQYLVLVYITVLNIVK
ncbi:tectonic-1 [Zophobas morio]|uniref:tectonic-1 n=1 Tax=Zophobas morio TaxID=2755281 RepID=UPI003083A327